jgi:hypothetical protein
MEECRRIAEERENTAVRTDDVGGGGNRSNSEESEIPVASHRCAA